MLDVINRKTRKLELRGVYIYSKLFPFLIFLPKDFLKGIFFLNSVIKVPKNVKMILETKLAFTEIMFDRSGSKLRLPRVQWEQYALDVRG